MAPGSEQKIAFITTDGHYEPNMMQMGVANGPAIFQKLMSKAPKMVGKDLVFPFIDDTIAVRDRYDEHLNGLRRVFEVMREVGLKIRLSQCSFFRECANIGWFRKTSFIPQFLGCPEAG